MKAEFPVKPSVILMAPVSGALDAAIVMPDHERSLVIADANAAGGVQMQFSLCPCQVRGVRADAVADQDRQRAGVGRR